jgi:MFS family permease
MKHKIGNLFPALRNRNYQIYFTGQLVSLIGSWLQMVAQSWLVLQLTNSAFQIGLVAAAGTIPTLMFGLFGGVIVDRYPKRKIMLFTQTMAMILALTLGILTTLNIITVWHIAVLAFLLGCVTAIDGPARQSFIVEMVGKKDLASAISLNSGIFNAARVIGPSLAGFLIALVGTGGAFIFNGLSYIAVIIALYVMKVSSHQYHESSNPFSAIREGVSYSIHQPLIRVLLIYAGVTSVFGWSYTTIMPYIARNSFGVDAAGLGYFYAAAGIGALFSVILVSGWGNKLNPLLFILGGNGLFCASVTLFTFTTHMYSALFFLFLSGVGLLSMFSMMNTIIQQTVEDRFRGRVMSIYMIMFMGMMPLGSLQIGFLTEHLGYQTAIRIGTAIVFLCGILIIINRDRFTSSRD